MEQWERALEQALAETPEYPGNPEQIWQRVARRIGRPVPWYRRWQPLATAAAAAVLGLVWFGASRWYPAAPAVSPPLLAIDTRVLGQPQPGRPLRFNVVLGTHAGEPVVLGSGRLEVRSAEGELVWDSPIPGLSGQEVRGPAAMQLELDGPDAGDPGHYRAGVSLVATGPAGESVDVAGSLTEFFVPFPPGAVRRGEVAVGHPLTRGPVTARLDQLVLAEDATTVHFTLLGDGLSGGFQWRLIDPAGNPYPLVRTEYHRDGSRVVGRARFEPTLVTVPALLVRLERVGMLEHGVRVVELPYFWEWQVTLDP